MFYKNEREYILSTYDLYETAYDNGIDAQGMQIQTFQCKNEWTTDSKLHTAIQHSLQITDLHNTEINF